MGRHSNDCRSRRSNRSGARGHEAPRPGPRATRDRIGEVLAFASIAPAEIVADFCRSAATIRACSRPWSAGGRSARSFPKT
jgi:hypothetical protein